MEDEVSVKVDMGPSTSVTGPQRIARSTPVFVADFSASWLSFIASVTIAHPIDTLRVRWQTFGQSPMHTVRADGVRSLFAGIGGPMVGLGPIIAVIFAINENVRDAARRSGRLRVVVDNATAPNGFAIPQNVFCTPFTVLPRSNVTMAEAFVAGLVAGSVVSVVLCPISVVRVQQQNSSRAGSPRSVGARGRVDTDAARRRGGFVPRQRAGNVHGRRGAWYLLRHIRDAEASHRRQHRPGRARVQRLCRCVHHLVYLAAVAVPSWR
jgi:hypothetical protein